MDCYRFKHLSDGVLLRTLDEKAANERNCTAEVVALIAEVEERELYRGMGFSSMHEYCVRRLHLSEDAAYKRIQAARAARKFPAIFPGLADGRLSLSVVVRLRPHLTRENWRELLKESVHKTRKEVEQLLAIRFPRPDVPTLIRPVAPVGAPAQVTSPACGAQMPGIEEPAAGPVIQLVPEPVGPIASANDAGFVRGPLRSLEPAGQPAPASTPTPPRVEPLSAETYKVQFTMSSATHDKMRRLQDLLGSQVAAGDLDALLEHAFDVAIAQAEKRKFAATSRPRTPYAAKASNNPHYIPARVRREVYKRDGARCTFVSDSGHRCEARRDLEFDHVLPLARGGESTATNVRLLCRTHNQLEAERVLGYAFMEGKRQAGSI